jgi:hypothetical protein
MKRKKGRNGREERKGMKEGRKICGTQEEGKYKAIRHLG